MKTSQGFMRSMATGIAALSLLFSSPLVIGEEAPEESGLPSFTFSQSFSSKNMGEGVISNPGAIAESTLTLEWYGFEASITGLYDFTDDTGYEDNFEEWDYSIAYSHTFEEVGSLGAISAGLAWTYCDISHAPGDDYQELTLSFSLDDVVLAPSLDINWDFENGTWWFRAGIAHSWELIAEKLTWDSALDFHYGNRRWTGLDKAAITTAVLTTGPTFVLSDNISLFANVAISQAIDSAMREELRNDDMNNTSNVVFTVGLDIAF